MNHRRRMLSQWTAIAVVASGGCLSDAESDPPNHALDAAATTSAASGPSSATSTGSGGAAGTGGSENAAGGSGGASGAPTSVPKDGGFDAGRADASDARPGCAASPYLICEDFEGTAEGAVPSGWTKHGGASVSASDPAARGTHSLKITAAANGERRIYTDANKVGSGHWGRIFYRVELPVPTVFVHSTMVALQGVGPVGGSGEYRVVDTVKDANGKHQFLYNVQPNGAEFGKGSPYDWTFDGKWHCAEWHIDNADQSYRFYYDGNEVTSIALSNGAGKYGGTDIPPSFAELRVGWNNYQSASPGFVAWIDEVALDKNRIGCN
ncbi:MAG TPA: hypothetical protein VJT73_02235 [Polyangiaceae bacterium]|nr:hypothetical protein [Polyangiaceae bacterium]